MKYKLNLKNIVLILVSAILLVLPTYLIRFKIFNIPTTFLEIYIYLMFGLFVIMSFIAKRSNLSLMLDCRAPMGLAMTALLVIIALISSCFAVDRTAALGQWKAIFFDGFLAFIMFYNFRDDFIFKKLSVNFYIISGLIVSCWGILQRFHIIGLLNYQKVDPTVIATFNQGRILGPFESPNYLAMYLAPAILILIINLLRVDEFQSLKKYFWPIILILSVAIILTQSASAILAIIVTTALYLLTRSKNNFKWIYVILLALVLLFATLYLIRHSSKSGSVAARQEIYSAALKIGEKHQLLGIGMANFQQAFIDLPISGRLNYEAPHPHNVYLAFWVYMGIPGLIVFLILILSCLRKENYHDKKIYYFALILILINGLTDTTIFKNDLSIIFWYLTAMLI